VDHLAGHAAFILRQQSHRGVGHLHAQLAIVQQQRVAHAQGVEDLRVGQTHALGGSGDVLQVEGE